MVIIRARLESSVSIVVVCVWICVLVCIGGLLCHVDLRGDGRQVLYFALEVGNVLWLGEEC